ncbi:MAG: hypothetical protein GX614_09315 [Sandaracinaceae bacterium]|nr:hypothetical protein [Sandaracinaceae bacterium]
MTWKAPIQTLLLGLCLSLCLGVSLSSARADDDNSPTASAPTSRIYVGLYLHDISNLSLGEGTYDVDADLWAKWYGDFDPDEIRIANASDIERETLELSRDGEWHSARWRVRGTLRGDFPVHHFPLDRQAISVQLELPRAKGELVPDLAGSGIAHRFSITDWHWSPDFRPLVTTERYPSDLGSLVDEGRSAEVRRVRFEVALERPLTPVVLKLFLPLAIVALIVFLSLFVPPDALQPRLTMCVTGLVACFAFQFSVADVMPSVAYLTLADSLFIIVYILAIFCVTVAVAGHVLLARNQEALAKSIGRGAATVAPVGMVIAVLVSIPSRPPETPEPLAEAPKVERNASQKDLLRIGTTAPLRVAYSAIGAASYWGLTYEHEGRAQPLVLERMPRVENDAMRFLSDGTLAVTWRIREGARWSDGTPITAADIVLPLELRPDPRIESIEIVDPRTVVLRWSDRVVDAIRAPLLWPSQHLEASIDKDDEAALQDYLTNAVRPGTGPYQIESADESRIVATRNPHFALAPAAIARVELSRFEDSAALSDALRRGEIDLTTPNALSPEAFDAFENAPRFHAVEGPSSSFVFLALPLRETPWDNPNARRALLSAIDRAKLALDEWGDACRVAELPSLEELPPGSNPSRYAPDREAFEALGLVGTEIPIRWAPPISESFVEGIAANLEAVGLIPRLERVENTWPAWLAQDFEGLLVHQLRVERSANPAQWWALRSVAGRLQTEERHNAWTDEVAELVEQYEHALFRERREQLRQRLDRAWLEALPLIPLVFAGERIVADPALRGWDRAAEGLFGRTMDTWYFK